MKIKWGQYMLVGLFLQSSSQGLLPHLGSPQFSQSPLADSVSLAIHHQFLFQLEYDILNSILRCLDNVSVLLLIIPCWAYLACSYAFLFFYVDQDGPFLCFEEAAHENVVFLGSLSVFISINFPNEPKPTFLKYKFFVLLLPLLV